MAKIQTPHGISYLIPQPLSQQSCFIYNKNVFPYWIRGIPPKADLRPRLLLNQGYFANISFVQKPKTFPLVKQAEGIVILICH